MPLKKKIRKINKIETHVDDPTLEYIKFMAHPKEVGASFMLEIFVKLLKQDLVPFLKRYFLFEELDFLVFSERMSNRGPDLDLPRAIARAIEAEKTQFPKSYKKARREFPPQVKSGAIEKLKRLTPPQHAGLLALAWAVRHAGWGRKNRLNTMTVTDRLREVLDLKCED